MGGIVCIYHLDGAPCEAELLRRMAAASAHLGPGGTAIWTDGSIGLARLAPMAECGELIGTQPLASSDGQLRIVAAARIDNRRELLDELGDRRPSGGGPPTDAELILAAYRRWGDACPAHLIGDFAFALWDATRHHLLCARDALGVKPLHYAQVGNVLCIASEAQAVLAHPAVPRRLDELAVADWLANVWGEETRTFFRDVQQLAPAHSLRAGANVVVQRYWDIDARRTIRHPRDEDYADELRELLRRAVADRLRGTSAVIGVLLSGGMDSTSVAALASEQAAQLGRQLVAYSFAYDQEECYERRYSRAVADQLGIEIEYMPVRGRYLAQDLASFRPELESPFAGEEALLRAVFERHRERHGRLLLTGHGGDSLVQGSGYVFADRVARGDLGALKELLVLARVRHDPLHKLAYLAIVRPLLPDGPVLALGRITGRARRQLPAWLADDFVRRIDLVRRLQAQPPCPPGSRAWQHRYRRALHLGSVARAVHWLERRGTPFGLACRHPFLDRRLAEYVLAIPQELFVRGGLGKALLRQAMAGRLPECVLRRVDKTRLTRSVAETLREPGARQEVLAALDLRESAGRGMIVAEALRTAWQRFAAGGPDMVGYEMLRAVQFELWLREFGPSLGN